MKYYGTKNNKDYGFYEEKFKNSIEITDEYWQELLSQQLAGKIIICVGNKIIAINEGEYEYKDNHWQKLSPDEIEARQLNIKNAIRKQEIQTELDELDKKRIRALAEPALKDGETTWLEYYNSKILKLRAEYSTLT